MGALDKVRGARDELVAIAGTGVSTVEGSRFRVTTLPEPATLLYNRNICKDIPGRLARFTSLH
jgi:hypothetical protein